MEVKSEFMDFSDSDSQDIQSSFDILFKLSEEPLDSERAESDPNQEIKSDQTLDFSMGDLDLNVEDEYIFSQNMIDNNNNNTDNRNNGDINVENVNENNCQLDVPLNHIPVEQVGRALSPTLANSPELDSSLNNEFRETIGPQHVNMFENNCDTLFPKAVLRLGVKELIKMFPNQITEMFLLFCEEPEISQMIEPFLRPLQMAQQSPPQDVLDLEDIQIEDLFYTTSVSLQNPIQVSQQVSQQESHEPQPGGSQMDSNNRHVVDNTNDTNKGTNKRKKGRKTMISMGLTEEEIKDRRLQQNRASQQKRRNKAKRLRREPTEESVMRVNPEKHCLCIDAIEKSMALSDNDDVKNTLRVALDIVRELRQ